MKVYLSESIDEAACRQLAEHMEIVTDFEKPEELDAIIVRRVFVNRDLISRASKCKIIAMHGVGLDNIDLTAAEEYGIPVVNVPGESAESVAELVAAYILALSRKLKKAGVGLREGRYKNHGPAELIGTEIHGKTLGLVGFGHIAKRVAHIMGTAFQCRILVYSPHLTAEIADSYKVKKADSLNRLFEQSDYISVNVPLNPDTRNLINEKILAHANPHLILVDTSRGGVVNEKALYTALIQGKIAGAGLDVSEQEPMDKSNPLLLLDNVIATPHIGASTLDSKMRVGRIVVNNVFSACGIEEAE